ncbi:NmrA/HSCARG family protein [Actinosynnema sp. NPDC023658]|uniref:NmrA/HSCARG family protein n=1 Tax=Actinosynnema sp. NPDC023658 TaxID=3155465 RepID=UPI0033D1B10B
MTTSLVIGGTGAMGSRVVRRLAARADNAVVVLTRDPSSDRARDLVSELGDRVRLVRGDLDDAGSLRDAVAGVDEVFVNTDFQATISPLREYEQGLAALQAAERAGVERLVYSSLDNAVVLTGGRIPVPHYDSKAAVEAWIGLRRSEEMMRKDADGWYSRHVAVLVTAPYFENLQSRMSPRPGTLPDGRDGLLFTLPLGEAGRWPMIGLDDTAWYADHMLSNWDDWAGRTLSVVSEGLTGDRIASTFEQVTGIPAAYRPVPPDALRSSIPRIGHDLAAMFEFFTEFDVADRARDVAALRAIHPGLRSFVDWLTSTGWRGTEEEVQKKAFQVASQLRP